MPDELQQPDSANAEEARAEADEPMLWCPVCSQRLSQRKCKLFCEKCGYYMSCADYY
jgi:Zn finger protein HypA/HybF involved in hydrogenase expression